MAARFTPFALAAIATVIAFAGGMLTPDSMRERVKGAIAAAVAPASAPASAASASASAPAAAAASASASQVASAAAPASSSASSAVAVTPTPSVPMGSILLPSASPTTATYALQAGQFASQQAADQLASGLAGQGVPSTVTLVIDSSNTAWAVVSVGRFASADEAMAQRSRIANKLGLSQALSPITLPPPKPSP